LPSLGASRVHLHPLHAIEREDREAITMAAAHIGQRISQPATPVVPRFEREALFLVLATELIGTMSSVSAKNRSHVNPFAYGHEILLERNLKPERVSLRSRGLICNSEYGIYDIARGPDLVVTSPDNTPSIHNFAKEFLW